MESMKYDVVTMGSAVLDIYLKSSEFKKINSGEFEGGVALCEAYGGKVEVEEIAVTSGGGGTNTAVSFARKGFHVGVVAEMGQDLIGAMVVKELEQEGVDTSMLIQEVDEQTGVSSIMVSAVDGDRSVAVYRGASKMLTREDIDWERLKTNWLYISSLGGQVELLRELLQFADRNSIRVAVNPGKPEIQAIAASGERGEFFSDADLLILNREEAQLLTGERYDDESVWKSEACMLGPKTCIITDGPNGGKACSGGVCHFWQAGEQKAIERTGAGDSFGSGLVAALMKGKSLEEAVVWGDRQASSVVRFMGPKKGLLSLEEIQKA